MAKITVIVPVYKVEEFLRRCIDSILEQSFQDFELVLVDDGSPDTCPQICDSYAETDDRIVVIHKQNGGLSDARNAGIDWAMEHSNSEWLAFVDSDDYLHSDYLRILLETANRELADLVVCDFFRVNNQDEIIEEKRHFFTCVEEDKDRLFEYLSLDWHIGTAWNKLYQKAIFAQLRFAVGKIHEDSFIIHHVLWNCHRAAFVPNRLYYYRQRESSIMATETTKSKLDGLEALVERYEFGRKNHIAFCETSLSIDYLNELTKLRPTFSKQDALRFKQLKRRFARSFFCCPQNRSMKRYLSFYFTGLYCKAAETIKKCI